jgi:pimeloyl-ACP methyl ester carboxylesterase
MPGELALIVGLAAGLIALVILGLGLYGAIHLTRPRRTDFVDTAERWDLPQPEHLSLRSTDGVALSAYWLAGDSARPVVLIVHGHGSNKLTNLWLAADLFSDFNVLLLDLRGHGESGRAHGTVGYIERLDVRAAVSWLDERFGEVPIGVLGISMGGAAVINAAAENPRITAVVADSAFAWLRGPVYEAICARGYPRRVSGVLAWSVCAVAPWLGAQRGRRWGDPIEVVHLIAPRPLLLIHGAH